MDHKTNWTLHPWRLTINFVSWSVNELLNAAIKFYDCFNPINNCPHFKCLSVCWILCLITVCHETRDLKRKPSRLHGALILSFKAKNQQEPDANCLPFQEDSLLDSTSSIFTSDVVSSLNRGDENECLFPHTGKALAEKATYILIAFFPHIRFSLEFLLENLQGCPQTPAKTDSKSHGAKGT